MTPDDLETLRAVVRDAVAEALVSRRVGLLTIEQAGELIHTPAATVRRWVYEGRIKAYKPGKHPLIRESELLAFVEANESVSKRARRRAKRADPL